MGNVILNTGGESDRAKTELPNMAATLFLSIILVYLLMAVLFNNLLHPLTIQLSLPMAFVGAIIALIYMDQQLTVISLSGLPDGTYLVFVQMNILGDGGDRAYCYVDGTNVAQYTNETEVSPTGVVDAQINTSAKLSGGGNNTIDVGCEISSKLKFDDVYASLSLMQVSALN